MAPWQSSSVRWIRELIELRPDVVVGTGDFLGHPEGLSRTDRSVDALSRGIPGVVTHGSNDRVAPRVKTPSLMSWSLLVPTATTPVRRWILQVFRSYRTKRWAGATSTTVSLEWTYPR